MKIFSCLYFYRKFLSHSKTNINKFPQIANIQGGKKFDLRRRSQAEILYATMPYKSLGGEISPLPFDFVRGQNLQNRCTHQNHKSQIPK